VASRLLVLLCTLLIALGGTVVPAQAAPAPASTVARTALLGAHHPPAPYMGMSSFAGLESQVGRLDVVHYFQAWGGDIAGWNTSG
jgi:hypothetical protein